MEIPGGGRLDIDAPVQVGRKVFMGIRPQHLVESPRGLECRVRVCEPLGDETDVMLDGPGGGSITARLRLDAVPASESVMRLAPRPGTIHLFDAETGDRIEAQAS